MQLLGLPPDDDREPLPRRAERIRAERAKAAAKAEQAARRGAELRFLRQQDPEPVSPENLERFERQMPPWMRDALDGMPPESTVWRLIVLYRWVFPAPHEIGPKPAVVEPPVAPENPGRNAEEAAVNPRDAVLN
jgi:hypothetical protein